MSKHNLKMAAGENIYGSVSVMINYYTLYHYDSSHMLGGIP